MLKAVDCRAGARSLTPEQQRNTWPPTNASQPSHATRESYTVKRRRRNSPDLQHHPVDGMSCPPVVVGPASRNAALRFIAYGRRAAYSCSETIGARHRRRRRPPCPALLPELHNRAIQIGWSCWVIRQYRKIRYPISAAPLWGRHYLSGVADGRAGPHFPRLTGDGPFKGAAAGPNDCQAQ